MGHVGEETQVDEWAMAQFDFGNGVFARLSTGVQLGQDNHVRVFGSEGEIEIPSPWFCNGRGAGRARILLHRKGEDPEEIAIDVPKGIYAIEADTVAAHLESREAPCPAMGWADSLGQAAALDQWREAIGLAYPCEAPEAYAEPLGGRPLAVRRPNAMPYGELPGVGKPISRLVMGTMVQRNIAHATALFDDFFARGGNAFDTAYIYGRGRTEKLLGRWIRNRGLRGEVVIAAKGACAPDCNPQALVSQLKESLERLETDYVDVYVMHRDNTDIPVGEFVDVMNALKDEGRMRAFGGSNWTKERFDEANAYAKKHGKTGLAILSNNFSLARMVQPVWEGCLASSGPDYRAWHEANQVPLLAWSSQARAFFVPGTPVDPSWDSPDNLERRARCFAMAEERGVDPMALALAYVLHRPFPVYAAIGPASIAETVSSFGALDINLSPADRRRLDLQD